MWIEAVRTVLPENRYEQGKITEAVEELLPGEPGTLRRFHAATRVEARNLALPLERYGGLDGFGAANDAYIGVALNLGTRAVTDALKGAGLAPGDVDHLVFCSSTGVATPSLDSRVAQQAGLRPDVRRVPMFGLGCAGGAAGIARLHDILYGRSGQVGLLVCVELCSLTMQRDDGSVANLIASGLFGDGAAALVAVSDERPDGLVEPGGVTGSRGRIGPRVVATKSRLYPGTRRLMGWEVGEFGLRIVLAPELVDLVEARLADDVEGFLAEHGLSIAEVNSWVCHPGGPKVIDAIGRVLHLPEHALDVTWNSLRRLGNLSSVSVLNVLQETIAHRRPGPGEPAVLMALGPGFAAELVLLRW
ncbi:3-oxoacyl-[acyl-carrier-protein] synthase III C-terminal domain-containing protein [Thermopolyspora sp. NPDC052614]|uniref:type III polyketide synthase n=1 Tax=Thermopolyspora sp. NPDC052614 TaxID=3155682 RepID=UPI00341FA1A8